MCPCVRLFLKARPAWLRRALEAAERAGRDAGAPAAVTARHCSDGALAVTAPAIVDDELQRVPRP